jgi:hypothetical protein
VDGHLVVHIHLVKLINAADAVVSKHQRTSFNGKLVVLRLLGGSTGGRYRVQYNKSGVHYGRNAGEAVALGHR